MKKSIFLALLFLCTVKYTFAQFHSGGIKRHQVEKDGVPMKKENFENRLDNKTENFTKYFNWTPEQYAVLLSNEILSYYAKEATGIEKYWSLEDIKKILRDSTVILPPSHFNGCWQTCGMVAGKNGKAVFKWFSRNARSVANGDAKTDEMFVCVVMKAFGGKPLPILSLNCGNGVRSTCVERIVYEELEREIPNLGDDVREYEPVENFEYEYVYEDVTPPEIHTTVIRRQTDVPQQQVVYNNEPQQLVYQNPPQNRLMYNYYGGGNNAGWMNNVGWGAGFQQPSNYSNQQSWANNQSATSSNVNDNSNVFNNNTNVSYTSQPRPNTSNPNNYTSGSPAGVPGSNGLGWNGPGGVPSSGNNGGPVGVPGNGGPAGVPGSGNYGPGFSSGGGPSGAGGSSGRISWH